MPPPEEKPGNDMRQQREEEKEKENDERDLYSTKEKTQHELRGISYALIDELRHGLWAGQETVDIQDIRKVERFRPMDITVYDIQRLEDGQGCKKGTAWVEGKWIFGQYRINLKKGQKEKKTSEGKEDGSWWENQQKGKSSGYKGGQGKQKKGEKKGEKREAWQGKNARNAWDEL